MHIPTLVSTLLLGTALALPALARADEDYGPNIITDPCPVLEVATFANRVHVKCQQGGTTLVPFFAVPTGSASEATRLVTLGSAALMGAGKLEITYEVTSTTDIEAFGCLKRDCRRPLQLRLAK